MVNELKTSEAAVESLTAHVGELQAGDTMARARADHQVGQLLPVCVLLDPCIFITRTQMCRMFG